MFRGLQKSTQLPSQRLQISLRPLWRSVFRNVSGSFGAGRFSTLKTNQRSAAESQQNFLVVPTGPSSQQRSMSNMVSRKQEIRQEIEGSFHASVDLTAPRPEFQFVLPARDPSATGAGAGAEVALTAPRTPRLEYEFLLLGRTPPAVLLVDNHFIDKTEKLYELLKPRYDDRTSDFVSGPVSLTYSRDFGKSTLLKFIQAVFSPLPIIDGRKFHDVKAKIRSCKFGDALLKFGMHPVVLIEMRNMPENLHAEIESALIRGGLDEFTANQLAATCKCPTTLLTQGIKALNDRFLRATGVRSKTILLIDDYDRPSRVVDSGTQALRDEMVSILSLAKEKEQTGISLFILAGLTRIVGSVSGLDTLYANDADTAFQTAHHGLCGITLSEFVASASKQVDAIWNINSKEVLKELATTWSGFRFGLDRPAPELKDDPLFRPVDVWQFMSDLDMYSGDLTQLRSVTSSTWTTQTFGLKVRKTQQDYERLSRNLQGGFVSRDVMTASITREDYQSLPRDNVIKRAFYELGLLSVSYVEGNQVFLHPPNNKVLQTAFELIAKKTAYHPNLTNQDVAMRLSPTGLQTIVQSVQDHMNSMHGSGTEELPCKVELPKHQRNKANGGA